MTGMGGGGSGIAAVAVGDGTRSTFGPSAIAVSVTTTPFSRVALPASAEAASWAAAGNAMADAMKPTQPSARKEVEAPCASRLDLIMNTPFGRKIRVAGC